MDCWIFLSSWIIKKLVFKSIIKNIELIEIETNKSYVYKLVDGVLLSPIDYEEEVKSTISEKAKILSKLG